MITRHDFFLLSNTGAPERRPGREHRCASQTRIRPEAVINLNPAGGCRRPGRRRSHFERDWQPGRPARGDSRAANLNTGITAA